jgi:hypothetical protein
MGGTKLIRLYPARMGQLCPGSQPMDNYLGIIPPTVGDDLGVAAK